MTAVVITIHLILALLLIFLVLIQQSEGGGLGIGGGGGGGGMGGFMTGRSTANLLTRATGITAALFILTSITLAMMADSGRKGGRSLLDKPAPIEQAPAQPAAPAIPELPESPGK
jgi:preprotein translocase subunit SecG